MVAYLGSVLNGVHLLSDSAVLCFISGIIFFKGVATLEPSHQKYFLEQGGRKKNNSIHGYLTSNYTEEGSEN